MNLKRRIMSTAVTVATAATMIGTTPTASAIPLPTVTKKCTTTEGGRSLPWYYIDSMYATRSGSNWAGVFTFRVEISPNRTVSYSTGGGAYNSTRYVGHHATVVQMYLSGSLSNSGKTVTNPGKVNYFYSTNPYMDFYLQEHVTDWPYVNKYPTCRIYF